jgi:hypothetical protein
MKVMRTTSKPFNIEKRQVYEAYKAVKSNGGAAGADGQTIEQFDADLKSNLYKVWNRMSSGSYFPPPVRAAERVNDFATPGDVNLVCGRRVHWSVSSPEVVG